MTLLDLVEEWAQNKGLWTYRDMPESSPWRLETYINISKSEPGERSYIGQYMTLWPNGVCSFCVGHDVRLRPADPNFFIKLEALVEYAGTIVASPHDYK